MSSRSLHRARRSAAHRKRRDSCRYGATSCSTPTRRSRRSPSCGTARSRFCSSPHRPAARRGRATRSWAPRRARRGSSTTASSRTGRPHAAGTTIVGPTDPLADLEALVREAEPVEVPEIGEFWSGAVGYFGYDVVRIIERLPSPPPRGVQVPDALFVFTDALVIIDNLRSQARVVASARVSANAVRRRSDAPRTTPRMRTIDATDRPPARARRCSDRSISIPPPRPPRVTSVYAKEQFLHRRRHRAREVHRRRRRLPGADRAPHRRAARLLVDGPLSRAARDQSVAVHVPPRARRRGDRRQLTRAALRVTTSGKVTVRPIAGTRRRGR